MAAARRACAADLLQRPDALLSALGLDSAPPEAQPRHVGVEDAQQALSGSRLGSGLLALTARAPSATLTQ